MFKARLVYVMMVAALFAYVLAHAARGHFGMSDGGGW